MQPTYNRRAPSDDKVAPRPERLRLTILVGVLIVLSLAHWARTAYQTVVAVDNGSRGGARRLLGASVVEID